LGWGRSEARGREIERERERERERDRHGSGVGGWEMGKFLPQSQKDQKAVSDED
jgi:hypothetical protein